jgi:O-antigen/teichoic acid export membrane protein
MSKQATVELIDCTRARGLSFLLKDSVIYGGAAAISKAFSLITFPLLAQHFSVSEYGVIDFLFVITSFLISFFVFGQDSAVARFFYEYEDNRDRCQLITQSLLFQIIILSLFIPIMWFSVRWVAHVLVDWQDATYLFKLILLQLPFALLINFSQNLLKWSFSRGKFLIMTLGATIVQTLLMLLAINVYNVGIRGILIVGLCTAAVFGCMGLFFVRQWLTLPRNFVFLREMMPYAIPFGLICVLGAFSPILERTIITQFLNLNELGLYAVGTKIAMLIGILGNAFQMAWGPFSISIYKQPNAAQMYNLVLRILSIGLCCSVFLLVLFSDLIIKLLASSRYSGSELIVFPLSMGLAIQITSWVTEIGISISKRSYMNLYANGSFVLVTLGAILLLTPILGLLGVAVAVLISQIVKCIISSWLAQQVYPLPWQYKPILLLYLYSLVLWIVSLKLNYSYGHSYYYLSIIVGFLGILFISFTFLFNQEEKAVILRKIKLVGPI